MKSLRITLTPVLIAFLVLFSSCSKQNEREVLISDHQSLTGTEKRPGIAFLSVKVTFGEPTINPHFNPDMPASAMNPITVCVGFGICDIEIGYGTEDGTATCYPLKSEADNLELYFDHSSLSTEKLLNFSDDQIFVHKPLILKGDWLRQIGFESGEYTVESGYYEVNEDDGYLKVTL